MKYYKNTIPEVSLKYKKGDILKAKFHSSEDAYEYFKKIFDADTIDYYESFFAIFLNRANITTAWIKISQGGIGGTVADPKLIIKAALDVGASGIMLAHNHPSGEIKPSQNDIRLTEKVKNAGNFFDINLLDHIIVGSEDYYSFGDEGII